MFSRSIRLPMRFVALGVIVFWLSVGCAYVSGSVTEGQPSDQDIAGNTVSDNAVSGNPTGSTLVAKVSVEGAAQPLSADLMCFNVNSVQVPSWQSEPFLNATAQMRPRVLRIPGGEVANYWDWRRGGIIEDDSQLPDGLPEYMRYDARDHTGSKLEDYKTGLQATNTQALFVLNMLTSDLADQIDMLSAAARAGIEIKYVELGNEYYFGIPNYADKFPTPESYGETAKVWIEYLKDIFPGVKVSVFGAVPDPQGSPRENQWNQALLETALPLADAIALHIYSTPGLDPNGFSDSGYPAFDEGDFATVLGEPFRNWSEIRDRPSFDIIPADKEIWITEFNLIEDIFGDNSSRLPRVMGTWAHGLYAIAMNLMFLEDSRVQMTCNHDLVESFKFGAILPYENSLQVSPTQLFPVTPMTLSATGQALQTLGEAVSGMDNILALNFSDQPQLTGKDGFTYPALYGWRFESSPVAGSQANDSQDATGAASSAETTAETSAGTDTGSSAGTSGTSAGAIILNLSSNSVQLDIADIVVEGTEYRQLSADPRTLVTNAYSLASQQGSASSAIALPPYSVTQLLMP